MNDLASPLLPLSLTALSRLMPMFLWLDLSGAILGCGPTLARLIGPRRSFAEVFRLLHPAGMNGVEALIGQRLRLALRDPPQTELRGLAVGLPGAGVLLNLSFGIGVTEAVRDHALTEADFAPTDLAVEMLYLVEARAAVMQELAGLTGRLQQSRAAAEAQALTDPLTGVANRRALDQEIGHLADLAARGGPPFALLHLDLDLFKAVNDSLGHAAGDHVLIQVVDRLRAELRGQDMVARVGGDEFVILLRGVTAPAALAALSDRLIARLEAPMTFQGHNCRISASIGVTSSDRYPRPNATQMLSDADAALYAAKRRGRGGWVAHRPEDADPTSRRDWTSP